MNITVIGAGTWGTALARLLAFNHHHVTLWSHTPAQLLQLQKTQRHPNLPGAQIPDSLHYEPNIQNALQDAALVLFVVPSIFIRETVEKAADFIPDGAILVTASKGIDKDRLLLLSEVIEEVLQEKRPGLTFESVALSGPTHAEEVARDLPSAIVAASTDLDAAEKVQDAFMNENFRVYTNHDIRGVELCGAMKNIVALAAGISDGLGFGDNAKAALITRGMAEITRLGVALGCEMETFSGLAGFGDLIVTATSVHSRNHRCGALIGRGMSVKDAISEVGQVVEGMNALPAARRLAEQTKIEMPIVEAIAGILKGEDPRETVLGLMTREKKKETTKNMSNSAELG